MGGQHNRELIRAGQRVNRRVEAMQAGHIWTVSKPDADVTERVLKMMPFRRIHRFRY